MVSFMHLFSPANPVLVNSYQAWAIIDIIIFRQIPMALLANHITKLYRHRREIDLG